MEINGSKVSVAVATLGVLVLIWVGRSTSLPSEATSGAPTDDGSESGLAEGVMRRNLAPRTGLTLHGHLDVETKSRPQPRLRRLHAQRPRDLEADPQFQKLLEMDSARKMALLQNDPEELKRVQHELLADGMIPRRVLEGALLDSNPEVRLAALYEIGLAMDDPPLELLAPVLQGDPSAEVRLEALTLIAEVETEEAGALIQGALDDPDAGVSDEAQDIIETRIDEFSS